MIISAFPFPSPPSPLPLFLFFDVFGGIKYQAASPDEVTLVDAARNLGFFFHVCIAHSPLSPSSLLSPSRSRSLTVCIQTRNPRDIICNIMGEDVQFQILNVLEFNSTRKRMSERQLIITLGLCLGWLANALPCGREIPVDEYEEWNKKFYEANVAIDEREKKVRSSLL